jgi:Fur family transcriptional regulator, ferric uptake regulator
MCNGCDYGALMEASGLGQTENRLRVLEVVGNNNFPLSAGDIYQTLARSSTINRVTIYRILDALVEHGLIERISTGGRAFCYGLAPSDHHPPHPHFYCKQCGQMNCLNPESLPIDTDPLSKTFPGRIDKVEVRVDGICRNCMRLAEKG